MLALMFLLPWQLALNVLSHITLPVILIFPLATMMLGNLLANRLQRETISQSLQENEFLFRSQFYLGNLGMAITSTDQRWLRVNPRLCEMLAYSEQELTSLTWSNLTHLDDLQADLSQIQRMMAGEINGYELDKRFIRKDGKVIFTHVTISCYRIQEEVRFIIAGILDFSERIHTETALRASEEQLTMVLTGGELGYWDWDITTNTVHRNRRWAEMLGYTEEEIQHSVNQWLDFIHPDDRAAAWQSINDHLEGRTAQHRLEYRMITKQGAYRWILDTAKVVSYDPQGKPLRMCGTHADITERRADEESSRLASLVYENSSEAMAVIAADGNVISINPAYTEITGYQPQEVMGHFFKLFEIEQNEKIMEAIQSTGTWQGELSYQRKNGDECVIWLTINSILNENGTVHRRVALFSDITDRKESEEIIWKQANFDPLTGLPNRRMFMEHLEKETRKAERSRKPVVLFFLDLDLFKEINDTLGHDSGDLLLKETALRLRNSVRDSDTVSRLGGDEFTVILSNIEDSGIIERVAEEILRKLAEPFEVGLETVYISASLGITLYPDDATDVETLLKNADQAMYAAKDLGRNRFNYFTPSMQEAARNRMQLANDLRQALNNNEFEVYYQGILDLHTQSIYKAEALLRWHHPTRGEVSPLEFIPIAENTGMIHEIGDWVFNQTIDQICRWREELKLDIQVSINKSPVQFRDEGRCISDWLSRLRERGLKGDAIVIEITEGLLLDASQSVTERLLTFRDAGIQVSLDDFGTGYSSLAYLKKFDIDYLKIDRSFVQNLEKNSDDMVLCEAIIVMAHKLGIKVIAEGVETLEQSKLLSAAGCDYAQGYLYSRPVPGADFAHLFLQTV
jgi:diguanylate cyclase (GGDEF)-like protein/PAS domain S-box-containing protein